VSGANAHITASTGPTNDNDVATKEYVDAVAAPNAARVGYLILGLGGSAPLTSGTTNIGNSTPSTSRVYAVEANVANRDVGVGTISVGTATQPARFLTFAYANGSFTSAWPFFASGNDAIAPDTQLIVTHTMSTPGGMGTLRVVIQYYDP
jgi:hypothetical protein